MEEEKKIKTIDIKEFREKGYLQEVNRRFFHPLGLALAVDKKDDGTEVLKEVWDSREDVEGFFYDIKNSDQERKDKFKKNAEFIDSQFKKYEENRKETLGFVIEPVDL